MASHIMSMKAKPRPSALGLIVLSMLLEEPMHAYRMQKLITQRGKNKVVNVRRPASIYQVLERLVRLGLVDLRETVPTESHPDRIIYAITPQGRKTAKAWLGEMLATVGGEFPDFPAAVSVIPMLTPADAKRKFELRVAAIQSELKKLKEDNKVAGDVPRLFLLEDAYRTSLLQAEQSWLQATVKKFESGELTWNEKWLRAIAAKLAPKE